jgi:glycosyltransferase involved in cell wall biosynthesis
VLVDDGSDEPPGAWLSAWNAKRVRLITTPHRGVSHARNVGLDHCHGDFIRFLDGDDVILPESTSALLELAGGEPSVVTYGPTVLCGPDLRPRTTIRSRLSGRIHLQTALGHFKSTLPAMLMHRETVARVGGFDERLIVQEDWDFVLRVSEVADFRGMRQPVYLYRRNENSLTSWGRAHQEAVRATVLIIRGYLNRHPELHGTRAERRVRAYAQFLITKFQNPRFPIRSHRFWRAAAADPVRGAVIAGARTAALSARAVKAVMRAVRP